MVTKHAVETPEILMGFIIVYPEPCNHRRGYHKVLLRQNLLISYCCFHLIIMHFSGDFFPSLFNCLKLLLLSQTRTWWWASFTI